MTPRTLMSAATVAVAMLVGSQPAYAQTRYDFNVPFSFVANGRTFTAGQYVLVSSDVRDVLTLESRNPKDGAVVLPVETRIAGRRSLSEPEVVFDKVNDKYFVSELLVPGDDGYLLLVTKATHTHESVKAAPVKK
jgi:hypothetical protein